MRLLGESYLAKSPTPFAAYNRLQVALLQRFMHRGGTLERWIERFAPIFRRRYGWLCEPVPVVVRPESRRDPRYRDRRHYY